MCTAPDAQMVSFYRPKAMGFERESPRIKYVYRLSEKCSSSQHGKGTVLHSNTLRHIRHASFGLTVGLTRVAGPRPRASL